MSRFVLNPDAPAVHSLDMTIWNDSWTEPERRLRGRHGEWLRSATQRRDGI